MPLQNAPAAHTASAVPIERLQACADLLKKADADQSLDALDHLSIILEGAERQYQQLVGDPHISPGQRSQYAIGQVSWQLDQEEMCSQRIHERWTYNSEASLEQRVAGLRFLLSCLTAWQQQSPLEDIMGSLRVWATEDEEKRQARGDEQSEPQHGVCREALRAYAAGLLAIGLSDDETCEEAVRDGIITKLACYLNRAVLGTKRLAQQALPTASCQAETEAVSIPAPRQYAAAPVCRSTVGGMEYIPAHGAAVLQQDDGSPAYSHLLSDQLFEAAHFQPADAIYPAETSMHAAAREAHAAVVRQRAAEVDRLRLLRMRSTVQCCACMGEYQECLAPLMAEGIVDVVLHLLADWRLQAVELVDVLRLLCSLLAHRRIAEQVVDRGGVQLLLSLPHSQHTRGFMSMALFCLSSIPQVMERLCGLPAPVPEQLISTALSFLTSGLDPARRNAAQFLAIAVRVRCMLAEFDRQGGLQRLLAVLRANLVLIVGPQAADARMDKQVGYHATAVLQHYCWMHLVLQANAVRRRLPSGSPASKQASTSHARPVALSLEVLEDAIAALQAMQTCARDHQEFLPWIQPFLQAEGCQMMLAFVQISPREKYFMEMAIHALHVLRAAVLEPAARAAVSQAAMQDHTGIEILLNAVISTASTGESEVAHAALLVVSSLVQPPLLSHNLAAGAEEAQHLAQPAPCPTAAAARAAVRAAGGIRQLIGLLTPRCTPVGGPDLRGVAAYCLLGLAQEPALCRILARLQIARLLAELVHEPCAGVPWRRASCEGAATAATAAAPPHEAFSKTALQLISLTTAGIGTSSAAAAAEAPGPALHRLEREAIAASTEISYPQSELMLLIHEHLHASGLHAAARALREEAGLEAAKVPFGAARRDIMQAIDEAGHQQEAPKAASSHSDSKLPAAKSGPPPQKRTLTVSPALLQSLGSDRADADCNSPTGAAEPEAADQQHPLVSSVTGRVESACSSAALRKDSAGSISAPASGMRKRQLASKTSHEDIPAGSIQLFGAPSGKRARFGQGVQQWSQPSCTPQPPGLPVQPAPGAVGRKMGLAQLLQNLPRRSATLPACRTPKPPQRHPELPPSKASAHLAVASPPPRSTARPAANVASQAEQSRLSGIVLQYLRHQHRHACLQAPVPIATLPPLSLLAPSALPEAKRTLSAPSNVAARLRQRERHPPHGGSSGRRRERQQQFGSFRQIRSLRDADAALRSCAFIRGDTCMAVGCHAGSMQILNVQSGEAMCASDSPHSAAVSQIRVWEDGGSSSRILSSTRSDVRLWEGSALASYTEISGMRHAVFHPSGLRFAAVATAGRQACIWDVTRAAQEPWTLEAPAILHSAGASSRLPRDAVCFNASGELLLHGPLLWDWRSSRSVHCFDVFSDAPGSSSFHPHGLEVILNSEVWDLRMLRLLRSVPCLDGTVLTWTHSGDAAFAALHKCSDDLRSATHARRSRHPLHTAFRTVDASGYAEIATVGMDGRLIMDLALEPSDNLVALATAEPHEMTSSSIRVYRIGAQHVKDDPEDDEGVSDGDKADESEDEEPAMPWRGMSAELAALSTPGSIHARSHGDSDNASESGESSDADHEQDDESVEPGSGDTGSGSSSSESASDGSIDGRPSEESITDEEGYSVSSASDSSEEQTDANHEQQ